MERLPNWETRLAEYLAGALVEVRAERAHFCALFAAGAVQAVTGEDPAAGFRGRFSEVAEALEATIDGLLRVRAIAFARRGDLAWNDGAVGVVIGTDALFVGVNEHGQPDLVRVPRAEWQKAWSVGVV